jgi:peptidoglycan/xylan/chitin deacetylase (PgdA/CDA1 family)
MIVLNYHRVSERDTRSDFYTVPPSVFTAHMQVLANRGTRVVTSDDVIDGRADNSAVMLNFDDGTADHYETVAPILARHGFRGVFFVSTSKVGADGYLSESDIREMTASGHIIECHGYSHRRMDRMAPEELADELRKSVQDIHRLTGRQPRIIAPPGGFVAHHVVKVATRMGMEIVRTMCWSDNRLPLRGKLDCLVAHHSTGPETIERWLDGKGLWSLKARYRAKQLARAVLPLDFYLTLRRQLIRTKKPAC